MIEVIKYIVFLFSTIFFSSFAVVAGGYFASIGEMSFPIAWVFGVIGLTIMDIILYKIGYHSKMPKMIASRIKSRFKKSDNKFFTKKTIFFIKFINGIRVFSYLSIGFLKVNFRDFLKIDIISNIVYVLIFLSLGYFLGASFYKNYKYIFAMISTIFIMVFFIVNARRHYIERHIMSKNKN